MRYTDMLYGSWDVPPLISALVGSEELVRLRGISQDVLPVSLLPYPMSSRFHHGMGTARLASAVIAANPSLGDDERALLLASALLHDAGSPPFSHLGEYFLRERTGKNGEMFLEDILDDSEAELILEHYGIDSCAVVNMVTGSTSSFSDVLCGTIDIDNMDNIARYISAAHFKIAMYDPLSLAQTFRLLSRDRWALDVSAYPMLRSWTSAREALYRAIYEPPRMTATMMLERAIGYAYLSGEIGDDFFRLTDDGAFAYLSQCNPSTGEMIDRIERWRWYEEVLDLVYEDAVPRSVVEHAGDWRYRARIADDIARELRMNTPDICVYIGKGRERRVINLPLIDTRGCERRCRIARKKYTKPIYRVKVCVHGNVVEEKKRKIAPLVSRFFEA